MYQLNSLSYNLFLFLFSIVLWSLISKVIKCPANALVLNDDCQTPLEVARAKGFTNVVRANEVLDKKIM